MPRDTDQLARLKGLVELDWNLTREGEDLIRWAVRRSGELEGALEEYGCHSLQCTDQAADTRRCICGFASALSPVPAKEEEAQA